MNLTIILYIAFLIWFVPTVITKKRKTNKIQKELEAELDQLRVLFYWTRYTIMPYQVSVDNDGYKWLHTGKRLTSLEEILFSNMSKQYAYAKHLRIELNKLYAQYKELYRTVHGYEASVDFNLDQFERPRLTANAK